MSEPAFQVDVHGRVILVANVLVLEELLAALRKLHGIPDPLGDARAEIARLREVAEMAGVFWDNGLLGDTARQNELGRLARAALEPK